MMGTPYAWECPRCKNVHAPWQSSCPTPQNNASGVVAGYNGTVTISGWSFGSSFSGVSGTVFLGPPSETTRARKVVDEWRDKGNSIKALIVAATDVLVEDAVACEEEDEDDD